MSERQFIRIDCICVTGIEPFIHYRAAGDVFDVDRRVSHGSGGSAAGFPAFQDLHTVSENLCYIDLPAGLVLL